MKRASIRRPAAMVACVLLASGCSQPEPDVSPTPVDGAPAELSESAPSPIPLIQPAPDPHADGTEALEDTAAASPEPSASAGGQAGPAAPPPDTGTPSPAPLEPSSPSDRPGEDQVLLAVADSQGDHGAQGPVHADLRALELVSSGNDVEVTLRFGGDLPLPPGEGEVTLVSVDVGDEEDGYQLFVTGNADGWTAYLYSQRQEGFVPYPGTFVVSGATMQLVVPWNAIGSPTRVPVRARVEWSRDRGGLLDALNPASDDRLDGQPHTFDRNP